MRYNFPFLSHNSLPIHLSFLFCISTPLASMEVLLLGFLLIGLLHVLEAISLRVKSQLTLDPLSFPASVTPPVTTLLKFQILLPWTCPFRHLPTCPIQIFCHFSGWLLPWPWLRPLPVWTVVVSFQPLSPEEVSLPSHLQLFIPERIQNVHQSLSASLAFKEQRSYHALAWCLNCWTPRAT